MWKERLTKKLETAKQKPVFYTVAADVTQACIETL